MNDGKDKSATLRGVLLLIAAVTAFAVVDGFSKLLVESHSFGQVMLSRYVLPLAFILAVNSRSGQRRLFATQSPFIQILRGLMPVLIGISLVLAFKFLSLADATTILFAGPFIVVALSGILLGENVAPWNWLGVGVGFLGVLIVARPGYSALSVYALLPAVGAVFYAAFQLLSRRLATAGETTEGMMAWTMLVGAVSCLPLALADWRPVDSRDMLVMLVVGTAMGCGHLIIPRAYKLATANVLAPFTYFQIFSAVVLGLLLFGEVPDSWTIGGIALIVVAGIAVLRTSRIDT